MARSTVAFASRCTLLANRGSKLLGIASAVALDSADVIFVAKGRISKVYLVDAAAEAAFTAAWISG